MGLKVLFRIINKKKMAGGHRKGDESDIYMRFRVENPGMADGDGDPDPWADVDKEKTEFDKEKPSIYLRVASDPSNGQMTLESKRCIGKFRIRYRPEEKRLDVLDPRINFNLDFPMGIYYSWSEFKNMVFLNRGAEYSRNYKSEDFPKISDLESMLSKLDPPIEFLGFRDD